MDLGPDCDYGMAYQINGAPQKKPGVFQCNVGYETIVLCGYTYLYIYANKLHPQFFFLVTKFID
jgi:hypothetical protein